MENYAQVLATIFYDVFTNTLRNKKQIWPRYHRHSDVNAQAPSRTHAATALCQRYLRIQSIQRGAASPTSIAWLAHQLIGLAKDGQTLCLIR